MSRKPKQLTFLKGSPTQFGGSTCKGNPKEKRPLPVKGTLHLVLKSKRAFGTRSMLAKNHVDRIDRLVRKQAKACAIKIYHFVNVGNHLHLVVGIHNRKLYRVFIRAVSGLIARLILKKERGLSGSPEGISRDNKNSKTRRIQRETFWVSRPFTRLVYWGRDFKNLAGYMQKNRIQAQRHGVRVAQKLGNAVPGFDIFSVNSRASATAVQNTG